MKLTCEQIVPQPGTIIRAYEFECPLCGRTVRRGGHAEGFRKAGFSNHVYACWEIVLYLRGYFIGNYRRTKPYGHFAVPIAEALKHDWGKRFDRSLKANIRKRAKDGVLERLRP